MDRSIAEQSPVVNFDLYVEYSFGYQRGEHESLPAPEYVVSVKTIPKSLPISARRYLEALRKNVETRSKYQELARNQSDRSRVSRSTEQPGLRLQQHLRVLRLKKRLEQVQVLQKYVSIVDQSQVAGADFFDLNERRKHEFAQATNLVPLELSKSEDGKRISNGIRQLELAVIAAKSQLDREQLLLESTREHPVRPKASANEASRLEALQSTKDELVSWIESKLSATPFYGLHINNDMGPLSQENSSISDLTKEIHVNYQRYVDARKKMIMLSAILQTPSKAPSLEALSKQFPENTHLSTSVTADDSPLPFIVTQLQQVAQTSKFYRQHAAYLTSIANDENRQTCGALSRLADESHILRSFPLVAKPGHAKTASYRISSLQSTPLSREDEPEMHQRMEAWKVAAESARGANQKHLERQLEEGRSALQEGQVWHQRLTEVLGETPEQPDDAEDGDLWIPAPRKENSYSQRPNAHSISSPWASIQGDLAVSERK